MRLLNDAEKDESNNMPFSSRHFKQCLEVGAKKFGWEKRTAGIGSMRRDGKILGWGMAGASWVALRLPCTASVEFCANGRLCVRCGTQDIGTGTYTIFAQVLHEKTGISLDRIDVILGDSALPDGPMSGGSMVTGSVLNAIAAGADGAIQKLQKLAAATSGSPFQNAKVESVSFTEGRLHGKDQNPADGLHFAELLKMARLSGLSAEGKTQPSWEDPKAKGVSLHSYGAQFLEVEWEPEIARLRVSRVVTVIDAGRIINPRAAANQIAGAVVMGVGMGLLEETIHDQRTGQPINGSMADYLMATCADAPAIDVTFLDYPDPAMGEYRRARCGRDRPGRSGTGHHRGGLSRHRRARARTAGAHRAPAAVEDCLRLKEAMTDLGQILSLWRELEDSGADYVLATVVAVEGSSYRKPGARMLLAPDGRRAGTVSGGCLEAEVMRRAWWLTSQGPVVERYSTAGR